MQRLCRRAALILMLTAVPFLAFAEEGITKAASADKAVAQAAAPVTAVEQPAAGPAKTERVIKFGYVDMVKVGSDSAQGKTAKARFEARAEKYQGQIAAKQKQLEKQKKAIQAKLAGMSPEQRATKAKEFDRKVEDFQKYVQKAEKEMQTLQEDVSRKLYKDIEQVVDSYGKANGFTAICVKKDVLYLASGVDVQDVTDAIIKLVNEKGQKP
ncbi:OmpH family outer membrane protein [Geotalea sp. SG265]|uniref:OmpH family outer membrane protein n=1 Tax=Geotalea sp. SG265 TaxID=2922867 RepID=UPI001FB0161A|nr:OmpH family outer membrane protein [Geotalea sp. SG265]